MTRARDRADNTGNNESKQDTNIALLAFKTAVNGSLAKFNLQDQIVDEYKDVDDIDTSASANAVLSGSSPEKYYSGQATVGQDADYTGITGSNTWYKWTDTGSTGFFTVAGTNQYEYLVVAGGGGGGKGEGNVGSDGGGGGGAGGYRNSTGSESSGADSSTEAKLTLNSGTTYTITVGAGGAGATSNSSKGTNGSPSSIAGSDITDVISLGGGGGGTDGVNDGADGGSGGGAAAKHNATTSGGTGTANQGRNGGGSNTGLSERAGGGGGGSYAAGAQATTNTGGAGGQGSVSAITGSSVTYAGGGGGGSGVENCSARAGGAGGSGVGGAGGCENTVGAVGAVNTGSGGGGGGHGTSNAAGGTGGSGIVILRGPTAPLGDLVLQSKATEAEAQPTKADLVTLIEDAGTGVATINTDIKGWVSRDNGTTFTQGTLIDEGEWGNNNKRVLAFHNLDISGQPSDKTMRYKITTHNSSSVKNVKIHATSLGWA